MSVNPPARRTPIIVVTLGLLAFVVLAVRFSPNWVAFHHGVREATVEATSPAHRAAVDRAIFSGHSERGRHVILQARDPRTEIENPVHKIVRWRLLVPLLGYVLKLPDWLTLGLAHLGCLALILTFAAIGLGRAAVPGRSAREAWSLAVIAGATAPFFTSMGWVGYYDSLLALALLGVALASRRWVVLTACLLGPWVDERFVLGLPLALVIRWVQYAPGTPSRWAWCREHALAPLALAISYAILRLGLGGAGGSQTLGDYLNQFVFGERVGASQRLYGAWAGLRVGWLLVAAAIVGLWHRSFPLDRAAAAVLAGGVALTATLGLVTALDLSRAMVLLIPVLPLGWAFVARTDWWRRYHVGPVAAALALVLPASHVIGKKSLPVDNMWSPSLPLMTAQNNLGLMYATGDGVEPDDRNAVHWYRKAVAHNFSVAQNNLGVMYAAGRGVAKDVNAAVDWYRSSAEQGDEKGQNNLGLMYIRGEGVDRDFAQALYWFRQAAGRNFAEAQNNLGVMYADGHGVPKDLVQAWAWFTLGSAGGQQNAPANRAMVEREMSPRQLTEARQLARTLAGQLDG